VEHDDPVAEGIGPVATDKRRLDELEARLDALPLPVVNWPPISRADCPAGPHRGPEGPNEDIAQCHQCWSVDHALRPEGETWGDHLADCSLPLRHESYCVGGGPGHPPAAKIRG
jgi:hypothetical protein